MNIDGFSLVHRVMTAGGVRAAAKELGYPVSTVAAAINRLQSQLAIALVHASGNRLLPTLEGRRLTAPLAELARLAAAIEGLAGGSDGAPAAERPAISIAMLSRFLAVCRHGSIRGAAIANGLGQPQLTRQMKHLEAALGGALFERYQTGVVPTALGGALLPLAEDMVVSWSQLHEGSSDRFRRDTTRIRLGAVNALGFESRLSRMLALLVTQWPKRRPGLRLYVSSATAEELIAGLRAGQYDLILLDTQAVPDEMRGVVVSRSPLAVVFAADLALRHPGGIGDLLLNAPVAAPSLRNGLRQRTETLIESALSTAQRSAVALVEVDMLPVIGSLVAEHGHVSILPSSSLPGSGARLSSILLDESYDMHLSLVQRRSGEMDGLMRTALDILADGRFLPEQV